jgi:acetyl esterase/lipase
MLKRRPLALPLLALAVVLLCAATCGREPRNVLYVSRTPEPGNATAAPKGAPMAGTVPRSTDPVPMEPAPEVPRPTPTSPKTPPADESAAPITGVNITTDIQFTQAGKRVLALDIYQPEPLPSTPAPVIVFFHGGGWKAGDKRKGHDMLSLLARHGYVCFSANYRLSQHAVFPAQAHDCKAALRWVRLHATEYGGDSARIGVTGTSAGGHLAALVGTSGDVEALEGNLTPTGVSSRVQAVVDWYGPADLRRSEFKGTQPLSMVTKLLGGTPEAKTQLATLASPAAHATADDPPFLIIHGTADDTVPVSQSRRLRDALVGAGVDVELIEVPGGGHGNFRDTKPNYRELERRMVEFFDKHLKP